MNPLLQTLASDEWAMIVKALLHTFWIGALAAAGLGFVLRGKPDPASRYRWCVGALLSVVLGGVVAWAVLQQRPTVIHESVPQHLPVPVAAAQAHEAFSAGAMEQQPEVSQWRWTSLLALIWLGGMAAMLGRAGSLVAGAERLRRQSRALENPTLLNLVQEARHKLGLARRVRVVVTEKLTSPAVMGVLAPVLILPLSMVTTLPMAQLQLILLHELAHIRRADYLVNLCQLLTESLLFFNPAVWLISAQIRQEREACCDAMATALAGERLQYARTLADAAGAALAAAPAFSDRRNPSGLKDRIQRLLVPGYRPALRLTWSALTTGFFIGTALLFLSAIGARVTVAAILSPQQRMDRIERKMTELGEKPVAWNDNNAPNVKLSGHVRAADGSRLPDWVYLNVCSSIEHSSYCSIEDAQKGSFTGTIRAGTIYIGTEVDGFAPASIGPLDGLSTNRIDNLELTLQRGFDAPLRLTGADDGKPVPDAKIVTTFSMRSSGFPSHSWKTDANGSVILTHCADCPLDVTANAPGYEITHKRFDHLRAGEPLRITLRRGVPVPAVVLDKITGRPVAGAEFRLLYQSGDAETMRFEWDDAMHRLGTSDSHGAFVLNQLARGVRYYIGISAAGHESVRLENVVAGQDKLVARLGPELMVRGRVLGKLDGLQNVDGFPVLDRPEYEVYEGNSYGRSQWVYLHTDSAGVTRFQFTNRMAGVAKLSSRDQTFERDVTAPVDNWVIDLAHGQSKTEARNLPQREVIFRFTHTSGGSPRGTVWISVPDNLNPNHLTAHQVELEITNSEVRAQIAIGGQTSIAPRRMIGYWFNQWGKSPEANLFNIPVTNGAGPMVVEVPVIPAGAVYATARNADGTPAGGLFFGVSELKRAPGRNEESPLDNGGDGFSDNLPRRWVSGPLPLGGTYQIDAWKGNLFCVSKPIKLTGENPDAEVELQFPPGKTFVGELLGPDKKPVAEAELKVSCTLLDQHSFGLKSVFTDENGRFQIDDATPQFGDYTVEPAVPGMMAETVKLKFGSRPQLIHLKAGRTLAGRLVQAGTGYAIPGSKVRAFDPETTGLPSVETITDANGRFEFTTLGDGSYTIFPEDGQSEKNEKFRPGKSANVVIPIKLYAWSKTKPKAP